MNNIRKIGLLIFCFSLAIFISTLFLNNYQLKNKHLISIDIDENLKVKLYEAFHKPSQIYSSKFKFIKELQAAINAVNKEVLNVYSINKEDVKKLNSKIEENNNYRLEYIDSLYAFNSEISRFKTTELKAYTSWLAGKSFKSNQEIKNHLKNSIESINSSIVNKKGIDIYMTKSIVFSLVKSASIGIVKKYRTVFIWITFILGCYGALIYIIPAIWKGFPGIKNNNIQYTSLNKKGIIGIILGSGLILFYVLLYWFPAYLAEWVNLLNPLSQILNGHEANNWFLYGLLYTIAILVMGVRFLIKYRHSKYQILRTISVMFFQLCFAFFMPNILGLLNLPSIDLKNIWPLDYSFFYEWRLKEYMAAGTLGYFMLIWGIALFIIIVPLFTYLYGKRWYCSWVCGCGGLAETAGDSFRQLSDKSLKAWRFERVSIYSVLVFSVIMTVLVLYTFFTGKNQMLGINSYSIRSIYGFLIASIFAGVVGTGFYPLMGNRVWCRFGCPLAAYLGIIQRFKSRFRITTNGSQCISCGNCSTYCEMGIDVRWYAQRGQNIVRASCVGCGICSAVCPRGVLRLENGPEKGRINTNPVF